MSGETTYFCNWMNIYYKEKYNISSGDTFYQLTLLSDLATQVYNRLGFNPFSGLTVEVWNQTVANNTDDNVDWNVECAAGLSLDNTIKLNQYYANAGCLSHELGHIYSQRCGMHNYGSNELQNLVGDNTTTANLLSTYRTLRSVDYTSRTKETERIAEDFKYFFGADGVANVRDLNDDANHSELVNNQQVRWADAVNGLCSFLKGVYPVYNYLQSIAYQSYSFTVSGNWGYFMWQRIETTWYGWKNYYWEGYWDGSFKRYNSSTNTWVNM